MKQYNPEALIPLVEKMINDGQLSRTLYTYMPIDLLDERVKPIFQECKLWFSSPANFNDPFDCKIYPRVPSDEELDYILLLTRKTQLCKITLLYMREFRNADLALHYKPLMM